MANWLLSPRAPASCPTQPGRGTPQHIAGDAQAAGRVDSCTCPYLARSSRRDRLAGDMTFQNVGSILPGLPKASCGRSSLAEALVGPAGAFPHADRGCPAWKRIPVRADGGRPGHPARSSTGSTSSGADSLAPEMRRSSRSLVSNPRSDPPEVFGAIIKSDIAKWAKVSRTPTSMLANRPYCAAPLPGS